MLLERIVPAGRWSAWIAAAFACSWATTFARFAADSFCSQSSPPSSAGQGPRVEGVLAGLGCGGSAAQERTECVQARGTVAGLGFMRAATELAGESSGAMYISAARRKDKGWPFSAQASMSKLLATDNAMKVCTDAIQVLGGAGYVEDHPVERYFREVKVLQILEGTNQIQRMVISRGLAG